MNGVSLEFANITTPLPSSGWLNFSEKERIDRIQSVIKNFTGNDKLEKAQPHNSPFINSTAGY